MATVIGSLVVEMSANVARLQQDMAEAKGHVNHAMEEMVRSAEMAKHALEAIGVGISVAEFGEFMASALEAADRMGKMAQKAGVSTEALSRMSVAAKLSDVDTASLAAAMGKLDKNMVAAQDGTSKQAQAFAQLGIEVTDANGKLKSADQVMAEVADKFKNAEDGAGKTAAAIAIFGKSGADLIPMLNGGSEEMDKFGKLADQLGLTLDGSTAQAAQDVNDRFQIMHMAVQGIGQTVMKDMLPTFTSLSEVMVDSATNTETLHAISNALSFTLKSLVSVGMGVVFAFHEVGNAIGGLAAAGAALAHGDFKGAGAILSDLKNNFDKDAADMSATMDKLWAEHDTVQKKVEETAHKDPLQFNPGNARNKQLDSLEERLQKQIDTYKMAAESETKLTETQKTRIQIEDQIIAGTLQLTSAERAHIEVMLKKVEMQEALAKQRQEERAAWEAANKIIEKANSSAKEQTEQIAFETSLIGKSIEERQRLTEARLIDMRVQKEIAAMSVNSKIDKDPAAQAAATQALLANADASKKAAEARRELMLVEQGLQLNQGVSEEQRYQHQLAAAKAYYEQSGQKAQDYMQLREDLQRQHEDNLVKIGISGRLTQAQFEEAHLKTQIGVVAGILQNATSQAAQHNKTMFEINKQASVANAIISTYEGMNKALSMGPWGIPLAAVIAAAGFMNVASIESAQFGGSSRGSAAVGGGTGAGAIPGQTANPNAVGAIPASANQNASQPVNLYIQGNVMTADFINNTVIPQIQNQITNADVTIIDPRSRQAAMLAVPAQ